MRLLDRYVLKNCLVPFLYCFLGFIAIWLVFDLSDNAGDFIEAKVPLFKVLRFYGTQVPQIVVISMPVGMLLALLYSLSRMSRSNEIISMLTAGRSVTRVLAPLFGLGIIAALVSLVLNYELAPHAEANKKMLLDELREKKKQTAEQQLFRNRADGRTWYVQNMPPRKRGVIGNELKGVCIITHGRSNANAIKNSIRVATELASGRINERIEAELRHSHAGTSAAKAD